MFYTVYKTTNKLNGRYYIGKHKTKNLEDGYMGSGKLLKLAIEKYGIENFEKEILFIFDNEDEMNSKERELVVLAEETYNLCPGGNGGFGYINESGVIKFKGKKHAEESKKKMGHPGNTFMKGKDPWNKGKKNIYSDEHLAKLRKPRSEETKRKIAESLKNRGRNSVAESQSSKLLVEGSIPSVRSNL